MTVGYNILVKLNSDCNFAKFKKNNDQTFKKNKTE